MRIVIVDESAGDRRLCRTLLEESYGSDLEVWEEATAEGGLQRCRVLVPDCVLVDDRLPDMTGLEFLPRLRELHPADEAGCAVVMLSRLASANVAVETLKAGAHDYLLKDRLSVIDLRLGVEKAVHKAALLCSIESERGQLARSLAEKEVLLKEVHHRVKNNLQVISSLLLLQANTLGDKVMTDALRQSQHRVESIALIHEQLYATGDLRQVDLARHATHIADNLFSSYGVDPLRVSLHVGFDPLPIGVDRAIPAGLILNELISNALKHGFPNERRGSISVEGTRANGRIELTVSDDGIGVGEEVDLERAKSLGLRIVKILTKQLKGAFELIRQDGAMFRISFPEAG